MIRNYARLIIMKEKTLAEVPASLRGAVISELARLGYDEEGDKL